MNTPDYMVKVFEQLSDIRSSVAESRILHEQNAKSLSEQKEDIKEHIRRTNILEDKILAHEAAQTIANSSTAEILKEHETKLNKALMPIKWLKITVWVVGGTSTVIGSMYGLLQWMKTP